MKHLLIALILSTFFCQFSFAKKTYSLTINVYSLWSTKPLKGAKITFEQDKQLVNAGVTDSTGTLVLTGLTEKTLSISIKDPSGVHANGTEFYSNYDIVNDTIQVYLHLTKNNERVYFAKREQQYSGNQSLVIDQDSLVKLPQSTQDSLGFIPAKSLMSKQENMRFLANSILYPQYCVEYDIQGKVRLSFVVQPYGTITTIEIVKGVHAELDKEAQRVLHYMPNWSPATINGTPIPIKGTTSVTFNLR